MSGPSIHANCVVVDGGGILIRGKSGSGKSTLSEAIIALARSEGASAALVADDRTLIDTSGGEVVASVPATIAGLIERRGVGIVEVDHVPLTTVRMVVDIVQPPENQSDGRGEHVVFGDVALPRMSAAFRDPDAARLVLLGFRTCFCRTQCDRSALALAPQHGRLRAPAPLAPLILSGRAGTPRGGLDLERNEFCAEIA